MQYKVKTLSLLSAFVLLMAVYILGLTLPGSGDGRGDGGSVIASPRDEGDISRIEIDNSDGSLQFSRDENGQWFISQDGKTYPGESSRIETFIENLLKIRRMAVVTEDPQKHDQFQVGRGDVPVVRITDSSGTTTAVHFGKADSGGMGEFARLNDENEVFITSRESSYLNRKLSYWGNLRLLPEGMGEEDIISFSFRGRKGLDVEGEWEEYALVKKGDSDDSWGMEGSGTDLDPVAVERLIRNTANLKADDFSHVSGSSELAVITVSTKDGGSHTVKATAGGSDEEVIIYSTGTEWVYVMKRAAFLRVCVPAEELLLQP